MKTSPRQPSRSGREKSMFSQADFPVSPSAMQEAEKELEDKSLLHMVVYGDEHEEIFNEGLTDYRWLVEEVTYKIGYSGETVFVTISHTY